ncbi:MAG: hypothetical protein IPK28_04800 [Devosia sp.]|nr:hypothetical protein [Devosia sp.]
MNLAGSQSLLLEVRTTAPRAPCRTSTVEWSNAPTKMGVATLSGKANIPARNLGVDVLIRKNSDPSLPASHLMSNFRVSDSFISVIPSPGCPACSERTKNWCRARRWSVSRPGSPATLSRLGFSGPPDDITANSNRADLAQGMDLALIYATGKRAIITPRKEATRRPPPCSTRWWAIGVFLLDA